MILLINFSPLIAFTLSTGNDPSPSGFGCNQISSHFHFNFNCKTCNKWKWYPNELQLYFRRRRRRFRRICHQTNWVRSPPGKINCWIPVTGGEWKRCQYIIHTSHFLFCFALSYNSKWSHLLNKVVVVIEIDIKISK